eukprot:SAG31_NODE_2209_length_6183_cov_6.782544_4_plen_242_part_00
MKMEERTREVLGRLQLMVQEARATVGRWQRRVMTAEDSDETDDYLLFCDDMLADAEDWLQACSWVLEKAKAELGAGWPGQFWELGATLAEEAADGATAEDLIIFVWAVAGEPPTVVVGSGVVDSDAVDSDAVDSEVADSEVVDSESADSEAEHSEAEVGEAVDRVAVGGEAVELETVEAEVAVAEDAESEATARAVVEAGAEAEGELVLTMGGLTTMTREEEVASELRRWRDRKRLFDPGG